MLQPGRRSSIPFSDRQPRIGLLGCSCPVGSSVRLSLALLASALIVSACGAPPSKAGGAVGGAVISPSPSVSTEIPSTPTPSPAPIPSPAPTAALPAPDEPIPSAPAALAAQLARTTAALDEAIHRWTTAGDPSAPNPPNDVVLLALYQQRVYRYLARHPVVAGWTIRLLPRPLAGAAHDIITAGHELFSIVRAAPSATAFKTQRPRPAGALLGYFQEGQSRFGVSWEVLAAVNYIESKFGRVRSASYAGAQGPMQFIPSTWAVYGLGGDVHDPHDAIMGAANYLHASGAPRNYRAALFHYNRSWAYVNAVLLYAKRMAADPRAYFAFYNWQVFVVTRSGDVRLTGPGR